MTMGRGWMIVEGRGLTQFKRGQYLLFGTGTRFTKVARYRRERMSMDRESSAQAEPIRLPLASSFPPHCHAACGEAAPLSALFQDERLQTTADG